MLIVLLGLSCSGKDTIASHLSSRCGFRRVHIAPDRELCQDDLHFRSANAFLDFATLNWKSLFVTTDRLTKQEIASFRKRPWALLIHVDAPAVWRYQMCLTKCKAAQDLPPSLLEFVQADDQVMFGPLLSLNGTLQDSGKLQLPSGPLSLPHPSPSPPASPALSRSTSKNPTHSPMPLADVLPLVHLTIRPASFTSLDQLFAHIDEIDLTSEKRVRPTWDDYFMTLAELASLRSNCMKRRVGAVLISSTRKVVISTGYNGTPRGMPNCSEGGCQRCNSASKLTTANGDGLAAEPVRSGMEMEECLCLHAEENALLEAGRERAGAGEGGGTLYCNTCPCLRCTVKIVQCGVREVVYSKSYSMDTNSAKVFESAGVKLRQIALKGD